MADRIVSEIVNDTADSATESREIDTCIYAAETYPKGYSRVSVMGPFVDGPWNAHWHPQGDERQGPTYDDLGPQEANEATSTDLEAAEIAAKRPDLFRNSR